MDSVGRGGFEVLVSGAYLGQSGNVKLVQLAHVVADSTEIGCHIQRDNESVEDSL